MRTGGQGPPGNQVFTLHPNEFITAVMTLSGQMRQVRALKGENQCIHLQK